MRRATLERVIPRKLALGALVLVLLASCTAATAVAKKPGRHRSAAPAGTPVPAGFVGMNVNGPLFISGDGLDLVEQFAAMRQVGVQTVRAAFSWADAQPYASWSDVPSEQKSRFVDVGGVPTDFSESDQVVSMAALYGLRVLPVVIYTPGWDAGATTSGALAPPGRTGPYANYLTGLIDRYGPHGSYWQIYSPALPIRQWQVWNEPNIQFYWPQPSVNGYINLLRAAHAAIVRADPGAHTILGAITNTSWRYLAAMYRVRGFRALFDVAAVNPFTSTAANVVEILRRARAAMDAGGDRRKPMVATELSWTSSHGVPGSHFDWDATPIGQAHRIAAVIPLLAANRRALKLVGFDWYTWIGDETQTKVDWNFSGLFRVVNGLAEAKPAYAAFKRAVAAVEKRPAG